MFECACRSRCCAIVNLLTARHDAILKGNDENLFFFGNKSIFKVFCGEFNDDPETVVRNKRKRKTKKYFVIRFSIYDTDNVFFLNIRNNSFKKKI